MTHIIAMANHKGGVGKTTSVASIGAVLAHKGRKTLLIDLDAQANLTNCFLGERELSATVYEALMGKRPLPIVKVKERLFLMPSDISLAKAEQELSTRMARERILRTLLDEVKKGYDYILLDCPPSLGLITTNALTAATDVYIPLTAEALPLKGLKMLDDIIREVAETVNPKLRLSGIFITRYNNRNLNNTVIESIRQRYGETLFTTRIRENISLAETPLAGKVIYDYAPSSNGAKDYEALTEEILAHDTYSHN